MNPAPAPFVPAAPAPAAPAPTPLESALFALARVHARRETDFDVPYLAVENAERVLGGVIATALLAANLRGRETTFRTVRRAESTGKQARRPHGVPQFGAAQVAIATFAAEELPEGGSGEFAEAPTPTYQQAVDSILRRTPAVARGWQDVAAVMARNGIAFARAASVRIAEQMRDALAGTIAVGQGREYARELMQLIAPWTRAYADTVYRTNVATAYSDGMFEFAADPEVRDAVAGFIFSATNDSNTRPNHAAADGLRARADDPIWLSLRPPLGFQCRCRLVVLTRAEAARRRMLTSRGMLPDAFAPQGAYPDPGFRR